jgi:hypothetical protein
MAIRIRSRINVSRGLRSELPSGSEDAIATADTSFIRTNTESIIAEVQAGVVPKIRPRKLSNWGTPEKFAEGVAGEI